MDYYDKEYVPRSFGLQNNSYLCYLNSFIQGLLSCSSINKLLLESDKTDDFLKELTLLLHMKKSNGYEILKIILDRIKNRKDILNFGRGQQDVNEAMNMFMEVIESKKIYFNFKHEYNLFLRCNNQLKLIGTDENYFFIIYDQINTDGLKDKLINIIEYTDHDYLCSVCKKKGQKKIFKKLIFFPNVIIILFNKYYKKYQNDLSEFIDIYNSLTNTVLKYRAVALIEHSGNQKGGHYWCVCLRKDGWKLINDISITNYKFRCSPNTYIMFYHIYK